MELDEALEERVREAYRGVVAKDGDRVVAAFRGLSDDDLLKAVSYGYYVIGRVVNDVLGSGASDDGVRGLADEIISEEGAWADLGADNAALVDLLRSASGGVPPSTGTDPGAVMFLASLPVGTCWPPTDSRIRSGGTTSIRFGPGWRPSHPAESAGFGGVPIDAARGRALSAFAAASRWLVTWDRCGRGRRAGR